MTLSSMYVYICNDNVTNDNYNYTLFFNLTGECSTAIDTDESYSYVLILD